jgi:hypothetical protein
MAFKAFLELDVLVPERMGEEIKTNTASTSFKQAI